MAPFFLTVLFLLVFARWLCADHIALARENAALRQQLAVYERKQPRPRVRDGDRLFWALLSRVWRNWRNALIIVRPETVLMAEKTVPGVLAQEIETRPACDRVFAEHEYQSIHAT